MGFADPNARKRSAMTKLLLRTGIHAGPVSISL
jgi:hypothetical protein